MLYRDSLAAMLQVSGELPAVQRWVPKAIVPPPDPLLSGVTLQITPPALHRPAARTLTEDLRRVNVAAGLAVSLSTLVAGHRRLVAAGGEERLQARPRGRPRPLCLHPDGRYHVAPGGLDGQHTRSRQGRLRLVADQPPTVRITYPRRDLTLDTLKPAQAGRHRGR